MPKTGRACSGCSKNTSSPRCSTAPATARSGSAKWPRNWPGGSTSKGCGTCSRKRSRAACGWYILSCDLVFSGADGRGGYVETDATDPVTVYGRTMAAGEEAILAADPAACILRISLPMGVSFSGHAGAIDWIASRFKKARPATLYFDEIRTPTYTDCLNRLCETMLAQPAERHLSRRRTAAAEPLPDRADHQPRGRIRPGLPDGHSSPPGRADPAAGGQRVHGLQQAHRGAGLRSVRSVAVLRLACADARRLGTASARAASRVRRKNCTGCWPPTPMWWKKRLDLCRQPV